MPVRIIGCGNIDRGDDAAGLLVARRLRGLGLEAQEQSGEALALLESWKGAEAVIVVDAIASGREPGKITLYDGRKGLWTIPPRHSTHDFGVAEAVELARSLDRLPERLLIYGIEAGQFELGSPPSAAVLRGVEKATARIANAVFMRRGLLFRRYCESR
jgi:hydrogenase maturation protease